MKVVPTKFPWPRTAEDGTPLGVDVRARHSDISRIVYKFFRVENLPMEELLQEIFLTICQKNFTRSAHDPRKSSFGHYVYLVANNVCINLVHKHRRYDREVKILDAPVGEDDQRTFLDTLDVESKTEDPVQADMEETEHLLRRNGHWEAARYVMLARKGHPSDVIREALSHSGKTVTSKTLRDIRDQVRKFLNAGDPKGSSVALVTREGSPRADATRVATRV